MSKPVSSLLQGVPDLPDYEIVRLLLAATDRDRSWLLGDPDVTDEVVEVFLAYVERRRSGEPIQYIEGSTQFGPIDLRVDARALIPRPETERLWELSVALVAEIESPVIVDLCTGSGNLALALKHTIPHSRVVGSDLSQDALALAQSNGAELGLDVSFVSGDLFAALPEELRHRVDLIVSNPPYVSEDEYTVLPGEVSGHEPSGALLAGPDGLDLLRRIADGAIDWLRPGGAIACEIGETQGNACKGLFASYGPRIEKDLSDRDRFVLGYAPMMRDVH